MGDVGSQGFGLKGNRVVRFPGSKSTKTPWKILDNFSDFSEKCFLKCNKKQKFGYTGSKKVSEFFFEKLITNGVIKLIK